MATKWGWRRALPICAFAWALAGCVPPPSPPPTPAIAAPPAPGPPIAAATMPALRPPPAGACRLIPAAVMTLLPFDAGKPVVAVAVNARILRMQVDTGAETTVLTEQGAQTLGLAPGPARVRVAGLGGAAGYGSVQLRRIDLAGQQLRGLTLPVMHLEGTDGMDGLIGADLLAPYQVQIDLPGHVMTLFRAYGCRHPAPLWPAISIGWTGAGGLPIVDGWLDGRKLALLLDTGANVSAVDAGAAALATAESRADRTSRSYGAGGLAIPARAHRFTRLQIGGMSIAAPTLRVIRLPPHLGIGGLIGMDLLAGRRLWLDAAGRRLYISDPPQS